MSTVVEQEILPLVAGDTLTCAEFLRRWETMPEIKRAELIRGVVYRPSPVGLDHGDYEGGASAFLGRYYYATPGTRISHNTTTRMLGDAPQPDIHLRLVPEAGGRTSRQGNFLHGAPEQITEVCVSSASYDLHQKLDLYEEAGVQEYLAILVHELEIRWFRLVNGRFQDLKPSPEGVWRSQVFPGLWLHGPAFLQGDVAKIVATLDEGLKSPEHAEFVQRLAEKMKSS